MSNYSPQAAPTGALKQQKIALETKHE